MKVYNNHHKNAPADAVYIGRPSRWGNPFTHLKSKTAAEVLVASREEAIVRYQEWLSGQPELIAAAKEELKGKDLVCWCKPAACHGDILIEIANQEEL